MGLMSRYVSVAWMFIIIAGIAFGNETNVDQFEPVINRLIVAINNQNYSVINQDFAQNMQDEFPTSKTKIFFKNLTKEYGLINSLGTKQYFPQKKIICPIYFELGVLDMTISLDSQNKIVELLFLPHTQKIAIPDKHQTRLFLPFKGRWQVFWGGDTPELNKHHETLNQRYAFDFIGLDEKGQSHRGDGKCNEDYFAFGQEVIAPADGIVTEMIDGVRDNIPGSMNPYSALGNAVFIQHCENEVSIIAHLKRGSIKVKSGEQIKRGQVIGLCGNSGNSSEPHIHYHFQNTSIIQDGIEIKVIFQKVMLIRNKQTETKMEYSPIKGDVIAND